MTKDVLKVILVVLAIGGIVVAGAALPPLRLYDEGTALNQRFRLDFTGTGISCADNSSTSTTECTYQTSPSVPMTATGKWYFAIMQGYGAAYTTPNFYPRQVNAVVGQNGCGANSQATTGSAPNSYDGIRCQPNVGVGSVGRLYTNSLFAVENGFKACYYTGVTSSASLVQRTWIAMTDQPTSIYLSNTPSYNYVGFRYSVDAGAPYWYACQDNASGAPNCASTGVAIDTGIHTFCVDCSSGTCVMTIDGAASTSLGASKIPTTTTTLGWVISLNNETSTQASFDHYLSWFETY